MTVTIMAAVARNGVIGRDGTLPWHLPADLRRFRKTTMGSVLVMGRRTYESIGRPLPGRTTVVVTSRQPYPADGQPVPGLIVAGTLEEALRRGLEQAVAAGDARDGGGGGGEVFVQGGARVYAEALAAADRMLITWVDDEPEGDTFFPDVDWSAWEEVAREDFPGGWWSTYHRRSVPSPGGSEHGAPRTPSPSGCLGPNQTARPGPGAGGAANGNLQP